MFGLTNLWSVFSVEWILVERNPLLDTSKQFTLQLSCVMSVVKWAYLLLFSVFRMLMFFSAGLVKLRVKRKPSRIMIQVSVTLGPIHLWDLAMAMFVKTVFNAERRTEVQEKSSLEDSCNLQWLGQTDWDDTWFIYLFTRQSLKSISPGSKICFQPRILPSLVLCCRWHSPIITRSLQSSAQSQCESSHPHNEQ